MDEILHQNLEVCQLRLKTQFRKLITFIVQNWFELPELTIPDQIMEIRPKIRLQICDFWLGKQIKENFGTQALMAEFLWEPRKPSTWFLVDGIWKLVYWPDLENCFRELEFVFMKTRSGFKTSLNGLIKSKLDKVMLPNFGK